MIVDVYVYCLRYNCNRHATSEKKKRKEFQQTAYVDCWKAVGRNSADEFPRRRLLPFVSSLVVQAVIGRENRRPEGRGLTVKFPQRATWPRLRISPYASSFSSLSLSVSLSVSLCLSGNRHTGPYSGRVLRTSASMLLSPVHLCLLANAPFTRINVGSKWHSAVKFHRL